jgi:hypothetical protein
MPFSPTKEFLWDSVSTLVCCPWISFSSPLFAYLLPAGMMTEGDGWSGKEESEN